MSKSDSKDNPRWDPDALVRLALLPTLAGGRQSPAFSQYSPLYQIKPDYLTSTTHLFLHREAVEPGCEVDAFVKLLTPEAHPNTLNVGQVIEVKEGPRLIGQATVKEIYNDILSAK